MAEGGCVKDGKVDSDLLITSLTRGAQEVSELDVNQ